MTTILTVLDQHDNPDWVLRQVYEYDNTQYLSAAAQELVRRGWCYVVGSSAAQPMWTNPQIDGAHTTHSACGVALWTIRRALGGRALRDAVRVLTD